MFFGGNVSQESPLKSAPVNVQACTDIQRSFNYCDIIGSQEDAIYFIGPPSLEVSVLNSS